MCWSITMHNYCGHCFQGMGHIAMGTTPCSEVEQAGGGRAGRCAMGLRKAETPNTRHCCVDCAAAARRQLEEAAAAAAGRTSSLDAPLALVLAGGCDVAPLSVPPRRAADQTKQDTDDKEARERERRNSTKDNKGLRRWSRRLSASFRRK